MTESRVADKPVQLDQSHGAARLLAIAAAGEGTSRRAERDKHQGGRTWLSVHILTKSRL